MQGVQLNKKQATRQKDNIYVAIIFLYCLLWQVTVYGSLNLLKIKLFCCCWHVFLYLRVKVLEALLVWPLVCNQLALGDPTTSIAPHNPASRITGTQNPSTILRWRFSADMPLTGGIINCEGTPGQTQNKLEGLYTPSGLETPWYASGGAGGSSRGEQCLSYFTSPTATAASTWISIRNGWRIWTKIWLNINIPKPGFSILHYTHTQFVQFFPAATQRGQMGRNHEMRKTRSDY